MTTLFKTAYLLGRGLRDLQLLSHALVGHVAWLPVDGENLSTSHEFTFGVGMSFIPYLLVLTPVV
jgi:hypothetical protein